MLLQTYPAAAGGTCDICHGPFEEGDYIAQPSGDEIMCPACILEALLLEAS